MTPTPTRDSAVSPVSVDDLAQEIRRIDGNNEKSAGYLAEAIMSFFASRTPNTEMVVKAEPVAWQKRSSVALFEPGEHWTEWEFCTLSEAEFIQERERDFDNVWAQSRPLYASPPSPAEVTDEQVEAAAVGLFRFDYPQDKWERFGQKDYHPEKYRAKARAALTSALQLNKKG